MQSIAVIGAGITGVTTAYALARRGFAVTVFERHLTLRWKPRAGQQEQQQRRNEGFA